MKNYQKQIAQLEEALDLIKRGRRNQAIVLIENTIDDLTEYENER